MDFCSNKLAIFDIDGVIANDRARVQFAIERKWYEYFNEKRMAADLLWLQGKQMIENAQLMGYQIAYMTGRRQDRRVLTEDWLDSHGLPWGRLTMRGFADTERLAEFKSKRIVKIIDSGLFDEVLLFDDDPEVISEVNKATKELVDYEVGVHCTWHKKEKSLIRTSGSTWSKTGSTTTGTKPAVSVAAAKPGQEGTLTKPAGYQSPYKSGVSEPMI